MPAVRAHLCLDATPLAWWMQEERMLSQMAGMIQAELAAEAAAEGVPGSVALER